MKVVLTKWYNQLEFYICIQIIQNINLKIPEEGEKVKRLVEIAKDRNIDYKPSAEAYSELVSYCDRKGIPNPLDDGH